MIYENFADIISLNKNAAIKKIVFEVNNLKTNIPVFIQENWFAITIIVGWLIFFSINIYNIKIICQKNCFLD